MKLNNREIMQKKTLVILVLLIGLLIIVGTSTFANSNYLREMSSSTVLPLTHDVKEMGEDFGSLLYEEDTKKLVLLNRAKRYRSKAFNKLKEAVRLEPSFSEQTFHRKAIDFVASWHFMTQWWEQEIQELDSSKIGSAMAISMKFKNYNTLLSLIKDKMTELTKELDRLD